MKNQKYKALIKKGTSYEWKECVIKDVALPFWNKAVFGARKDDFIFSTGLVPGQKQLKYNEDNHITPQSITRRTTSALGSQQPKNNFYVEPEQLNIAADPVVQYMTPKALEKAIERTRKQMIEAAKKLEFIEAAQYRDELIKLEQRLNDIKKS